MRTRLTAGILLALLLAPGLAAAQKLDKDDRKWLDDVRPILLPDEEKVYKSLKEKSDRLEFQRIFWARRDPDLATPENEYQTDFAKARAEADLAYRVPGQAGSTTDCGRVFLLFGKPDEVRKDDPASAALRSAETWVYRDKPGRTFQGGKVEIAFDSECRGNVTLGAQLDRIAGAQVAHPNIDYRIGKDGRLTKLADLLPRDTKARALFKAPRQDFPLAAQVAYLKVADGTTALVGLVRGDAAGLAAVEAGGTKSVSVSVAASAVTEDGREAGWAEQTMMAPVGADGGFVGSFKLGLKAGKYTLKAGAVDVKGDKGSLASMPIEVPDLARQETAADGTTSSVPSAASLILLRDVEDVPAGTSADPAHPFAAFSLGAARLVPFFGGRLQKSDAVSIFYQVYDMRTDAAGTADGVATITILKDGKTPVARTSNPITTPVGGSVIGPVPLASYETGKYVVQLRVIDNKAKKDVSQDASFEVVP
jgi:GWxTD domain-containing protein